MDLVWYGLFSRGRKDRYTFGPFKTTVPIGEIKKLSKTKNPFSAPALSIDRMEILYGHYKVALISPDHEEKFVVMLLEENPRIELDEKLKNHIEL